MEAERPRRRRLDRRGSTGDTHGGTARADRPDTGLANIGQSVVVQGELTGSEDLTIDGQVEGTINLQKHVLTIGRSGRIQARVAAKAVVVLGHVLGNITATERIEIREDGSVEGDIAAPRVGIADGAHFKGSIDMQDAAKAESRTEASGRTASASGTRPSVTARPTAATRKPAAVSQPSGSDSRATP